MREKKHWVLTKTADGKPGPYLVTNKNGPGSWYWEVHDKGGGTVASGNLAAANHVEATEKAKAKAKRFLKEG